jgi:hypothetical protein
MVADEKRTPLEGTGTALLHSDPLVYHPPLLPKKVRRESSW